MDARQISADVQVEFMLDTPVTLLRRSDGVEVTGSRVQWNAYYNGPECETADFGHISVTLFGGGTNTDVATSGVFGAIEDWPAPQVPNWCPNPPEGWDAQVRAFRATCAAVVAA